MANETIQQSPRWSRTTKTIVAVSAVVLLIALLVRFKSLAWQVIVAFLLAYLFHPLAKFLSERLHIPWKVAVSILYLVFVAALIGLLTWGGISIVNEITNLAGFLTNLLASLPQIVSDLVSKPLIFGPFSLDLPHLDLTSIYTYLQNLIQPAITETANLVASIATGAASVVTWIIFTLLISYFVSAETKGGSANPLQLEIPYYQADLDKMGNQLSHIWNSFLRGQLVVITICVLWYTLLLGSLGVNFFFGLAILAGLARFLPYVGPFIAWLTYFLVCIFQGSNIFGLQPFWFGVLIVGLALLSDVIIDNFVSTRVMSNALKVHPAAVLVTVFVGASLFGVVGMLLAAPVLATSILIFTYVYRKLLDRDPWKGLATYPEPRPIKDQFLGVWQRLKPVAIRIFNWLKKTYDDVKKRNGKTGKADSTHKEI